MSETTTISEIAGPISRRLYKFEKVREAKRLLQEVSARHGIGIKDLSGPGRSKHMVLARRDFCALAMNAGIGSPMAARFIGRHHATVIYHADAEFREAKNSKRDDIRPRKKRRARS